MGLIEIQAMRCFPKPVSRTTFTRGKLWNLFHQLNPYKCDKVAKQI